MLIVTWIVVGLLAAMNLLAGAGKAFTPWNGLQQKMPWTETTGKGVAYFAAWSEVIGAIGLIVPLLLAHLVNGWEWMIWVSFAAAIGLAIVQVLAIALHVKRGEFKALPVNVVLVLLSIAAAVLVLVTR